MTKAYILLKVIPGHERNIVKELKDISEIQEIDELYGEWDMIARISVEKLEELDAILSNKIRKIGGVRLTSTMIVAEYRY